MGDEQDRLLPIANVGRIMKQILPPTAKISKEAKQTMQECATEFLSFVTSEAADKCHKENRKTVNGDDICWALSSLGLDDFAEAIMRYLHKYRQAENDKVIQQKAKTNIINQDKEQQEQEEEDSHQNSQAEETHETTSPALLGFREFFEKGSTSSLT